MVSHMARRNDVYTSPANAFVLLFSLTCRRRHLKCDEEKPICGRCRRTARECIPDDLLTAALPRDADDSFQDEPENAHVFAEDHQWLATPSKRKDHFYVWPGIF